MRIAIGSCIVVAIIFVLWYAIHITVAAIREWRKANIIYYLIHRGHITYICRSKEFLNSIKEKGDKIEAHILTHG